MVNLNKKISLTRILTVLVALVCIILVSGVVFMLVRQLWIEQHSNHPWPSYYDHKQHSKGYDSYILEICNSGGCRPIVVTIKERSTPEKAEAEFKHWLKNYRSLRDEKHKNVKIYESLGIGRQSFLVEEKDMLGKLKPYKLYFIECNKFIEIDSFDDTLEVKKVAEIIRKNIEQDKCKNLTLKGCEKLITPKDLSVLGLPNWRIQCIPPIILY